MARKPNPESRIISDAQLDYGDPTVDEILGRLGVPPDADFDTALAAVWDRRGDLYPVERDVLSQAGFLPS